MLFLFLMLLVKNPIIVGGSQVDTLLVWQVYEQSELASNLPELLVTNNDTIEYWNRVSGDIEKWEITKVSQEKGKYCYFHVKYEGYEGMNSQKLRRKHYSVEKWRLECFYSMIDTLFLPKRFYEIEVK